MDEVGAVVEGYYAAESVHQLAEREGADMISLFMWVSVVPFIG